MRANVGVRDPVANPVVKVEMPMDHFVYVRMFRSSRSLWPLGGLLVSSIFGNTTHLFNKVCGSGEDFHDVIPEILPFLRWGSNRGEDVGDGTTNLIIPEVANRWGEGVDTPLSVS